jgi:hypothetical protein
MKKNTRKHTLNREWQTKDRQAFYERLHVACEKLVGKGYFERFPLHSLKLMYNLRYPSIRLSPENRKTISPEELHQYKSMMVKTLGPHLVETLTGEKISCIRFMSEAMLLIHFVQYRVGGTFRGAAALSEAFSLYSTKGEWYKRNMKTIVDLVVFGSVHFYDTTKGMLWVDTEKMGIVNAWEVNVIRFYRVRQQTCLQEIDDKKRVLIRMCMPHLDTIEPEWLSAKPSQFGLAGDVDSPLPIYIQQHALNRFEERTSFPLGLAQVLLYKDLNENTVSYHKRNGHSLVECRAGSGHKVGYYVMSYHEDKLVIRTFLFLTNDSTPEGKRLLKKTHLARLDTQYLMIDRFWTFYTHDVGNDPELRKLFTSAGCASLFDLSDEFSDMEGVHEKSAEYIHQYLAHLFVLAKTR